MKKKAKAVKKASPPPEAVHRPFEKLAKVKPSKAAAAPPRPARPAAASGPSTTPALASTADSFAIFMAGVKALDAKSTRIPRTSSEVEKTPKKASKEDLDAPARAAMRTLVIEGTRFETVDDGERIEGRRADVDPREIRRLRRGEYSVDGKLDLHGLAAGEARAAVEAFVSKRGAEGDRVVMIVHGKGLHSPRGAGILRGEIAAWLSQGRAARHVRAFATATEEDGGAGALLVLLAR